MDVAWQSRRHFKPEAHFERPNTKKSSVVI